MWAAPKASTTARGYGAAHQRERKRWTPIVNAGQATCTRCGKTIRPGQPWHLDHDDHNRTRYRGPAHAQCNVRAGAIKGAHNKHNKTTSKQPTTTHTTTGQTNRRGHSRFTPSSITRGVASPS